MVLPTHLFALVDSRHKLLRLHDDSVQVRLSTPVPKPVDTLNIFVFVGNEAQIFTDLFKVHLFENCVIVIANFLLEGHFKVKVFLRLECLFKHICLGSQYDIEVLSALADFPGRILKACDELGRLSLWIAQGDKFPPMKEAIFQPVFP